MANGAVLLKWRDRNWAEQGHYVYRSTSPMDINNLPDPIHTMAPNRYQYIDYDVIADQTYYYRIGAFRNNDVSVSDEIKVVATPNYDMVYTLVFEDSPPQGVWFDMSRDFLYTDLSKTNNVVNDGDPVAVIEDKSGNGLDAIQTDPVSRAIYRTDGVSEWLEFDGTNHFYQVGTPTDWTFFHRDQWTFLSDIEIIHKPAISMVANTYDVSSSNRGSSIFYDGRSSNLLRVETGSAIDRNYPVKAQYNDVLPPGFSVIRIEVDYLLPTIERVDTVIDGTELPLSNGSGTTPTTGVSLHTLVIGGLVTGHRFIGNIRSLMLIQGKLDNTTLSDAENFLINRY